jgi:hypothetical protein
MSHTPYVNTDREIWREVDGDYYSPSIHVTADGKIGINVGGIVYVKDVREWHSYASNKSLNINVSVTDTELFRDILDLFVELVHRLDDEQKRYFIDRMNEILGDRFLPIDYEEDAK